MALSYPLAHPQVSIKAISISHEETHPAVCIQHIGRELDELGIHNIPLGAGQDGPLPEQAYRHQDGLKRGYCGCEVTKRCPS